MFENCGLSIKTDIQLHREALEAGEKTDVLSALFVTGCQVGCCGCGSDWSIKQSSHVLGGAGLK